MLRMPLKKFDPEALATNLETVRIRIDRIAATVDDAELQERLALLREHVSVAANRLRLPTDVNLTRVAQRVRHTTRQIDVLMRGSNPKSRSAYRR